MMTQKCMPEPLRGHRQEGTPCTELEMAEHVYRLEPSSTSTTIAKLQYGGTASAIEATM